jgi:hypothetical protein
MTIKVLGTKEVNTTMDFTTTAKNPVTPPLPLHTDEKSPSCGNFGRSHDPAYSCLSPPPPPQGRRSDDTERAVSSTNSPLSNDLLVFPSLSAFNFQGGITSSGHIPTFKLQPKLGGLPSFHEGYFN